MPTRSVVECLNVVRNIFHCQCAILVDVLLDTFFFQTAEKGFRYRVDAPMSSGERRLLQVGQNERVQFSHDIALETAMDFLEGHTFLGATFNVRPSSGISAHTNHRDGP